MEGVFSLPVAVRTDFIHSLVQSLVGCSYICLWAYNHTILPNRLSFLDGFYNVISNQPSSSLGSVAQRLFNQYRILTFDVNDDHCVPGLAFRNQHPYLELQQLELLTLASTEIQTQFYQEARIKTAVFMGCNKGEIELGFLNMSQADIQTALRSLFPEDFSRHTHQIDQNPNPNPPSSSSSSLRSLSTGSPEYTSLIFNNNNIPGTSPSQFPDQTLGVGGGVPLPPMRPISNTPLQLQQQFSHPTQFPSQQLEHDAIMRAIQTVISSPTSSSHYQQQNWPNYVVHPEASAFKRYREDRNASNLIGSDHLRRQSLMKKSLAFFRNLNFMRIRERNVQATRPSNTQLHHMISERRRREKLNENFQGLRSLLPSGTKKDKASILITAKETLRSFIAEIDKLKKRNQELTTSLLPAKESTAEKTNISSNERLNVRVSHVQESSSSEEPIVDLQVNVRGQNSQLDLLIRLLEFLKQVHHVSLVSMDANTSNEEGINYLHQISFRLRISQGSEWDEHAFEEAVRRVVGDLIQYQVN